MTRVPKDLLPASPVPNLATPRTRWALVALALVAGWLLGAVPAGIVETEEAAACPDVVGTACSLADAPRRFDAAAYLNAALLGDLRAWLASGDAPTCPAGAQCAPTYPGETTRPPFPLLGTLPPLLAALAGGLAYLHTRFTLHAFVERTGAKRGRSRKPPAAPAHATMACPRGCGQSLPVNSMADRGALYSHAALCRGRPGRR